MKNKVVKNAGWIIGARVFQMLIGLFISTWTVRYLGPSNSGIIDYVDSFVSFAASIAILGLDKVIIKFLIDKDGKEDEVLGTTVAIRLIASVVCSLAAILLVAYLNPHDTVTTMVAVYLSLATVFRSFEMFNYWYQARLQSRVSSIIQTIAYLCTAAFRLYILITNKNVLWFAFGNSMDSIVIAVLLYISYKRSHGGKLQFKVSLGKEILSQSHHFIYASLMIAIYGQMDKIMIEKWLDFSAVGYYGVAGGVNTMWTFVLQAFIDSIYPTVIEAKKSGDEKLYHKRVVQLYSVVIWVSVLASVMITLLAGPIILILYGEAYAPSINCLRILTWMNTFAYLGVARAAWMVCENTQNYQKYILAMGAGANLILNWILIPVMGFNGAALATVITQMITGFFGAFAFKKTRPNSIMIIEAFNPSVMIDLVKTLRKEG